MFFNNLLTCDYFEFSWEKKLFSLSHFIPSVFFILFFISKPKNRMEKKQQKQNTQEQIFCEIEKFYT